MLAHKCGDRRPDQRSSIRVEAQQHYSGRLNSASEHEGAKVFIFCDQYSLVFQRQLQKFRIYCLLRKLGNGYDIVTVCAKRPNR